MRFGTVAAFIAACAVAVAAPVSLGSSRSAAGPSLRLASTKPLVVRGRAFRAGERVRVSLVSEPIRMRRTVTASGSGTFTVRFGTITYGPCIGFTIRATGSGGSVAVLKRPPLPGCMPE